MKTTLIFLLISILGGQVLAAESPETVAETKFIENSKCLAKEKLVLADVVEFALDDKMELAEKNPKLKCFASCMMEYAKILDGCKLVFDKNFNMDMLAGETKEEFMAIMESCKGVVKGTDRCECGYQLVKCMTEKEKKP